MELITKLDRTFLFASYFRALKNAQAKLKAQQQQQQQQQDVSVNFYVFFMCLYSQTFARHSINSLFSFALSGGASWFPQEFLLNAKFNYINIYLSGNIDMDFQNGSVHLRKYISCSNSESKKSIELDKLHINNNTTHSHGIFKTCS